MLRVLAVVLASGVAGCAFVPSGLPSSDDVPADPDAAVGDPDATASDAPGPPPIDSRTVDAPPPIDAAPGCPYGYRYIATHKTWRDAELDCEDDAPGRSHLVVIDDGIELGVVRVVLVLAERAVWIGMLRDRSQETDPGEWDWRYVTGDDATYHPWATGEPDNGSPNRDGFVVRLDKSTGQYYDRSIDDVLPALCECDNQPPMNADYDPTP